MKTVTKKVVEGLQIQDQTGIDFPWFYNYEKEDFVKDEEDIAEYAQKYGVPEELIRSIVKGVADRTHEITKAIVTDMSALWLRMDDLEKQLK